MKLARIMLWRSLRASSTIYQLHSPNAKQRVQGIWIPEIAWMRISTHLKYLQTATAAIEDIASLRNTLRNAEPYQRPQIEFSLLILMPSSDLITYYKLASWSEFCATCGTV